MKKDLQNLIHTLFKLNEFLNETHETIQNLDFDGFTSS